jgi:hypothetical protein
MSQANELLDNLTDEQIATYAAGSETEEHIVIGTDRFITVPDSLKRIAVQYDHNVETVTFDCPRYWDGLDMSTMDIRIPYEKENGETGRYDVTSVTVDETNTDIMHFDWVIDRDVTSVNGKISFSVCITRTDEEGTEINHWNTEINSQMYVSEGLEASTVITEQYPDVIAQILSMIDELRKNGGGSVNVTATVENGILYIK